MTSTDKIRTITLTISAPVKIHEEEWPVIAQATGRSRICYHTPIPDHEVDSYSLRVRQHADGRTIVYGVLAASPAWTGTESRRGGEILIPPGDGPPTADDGRVVGDEAIVRAIRKVGLECGLPESVIRDCIADLPATKL